MVPFISKHLEWYNHESGRSERGLGGGASAPLYRLSYRIINHNLWIEFYMAYPQLHPAILLDEYQYISPMLVDKKVGNPAVREDMSSRRQHHLTKFLLLAVANKKHLTAFPG